MKNIKKQIENELLVMYCQDGDVEAFNLLVKSWQNQFLRHAHRLVNNADIAGDIVQEVWIAVIKGIHKLNDPSCFRSWAYRIVMNKSYDWIKKNKKTSELQDDIKDKSIEKDKSSISIDVREYFKFLSFEKRNILTLFYLEEFSIIEISRVLKIPLGTVKSRLFNARKELKLLMTK